MVLPSTVHVFSYFGFSSLGTGQKVSGGGGGGAEQRGGGSSVFEPLVRGGSFNFQLPLKGGSSCFFFMGISTHLTTKVTRCKKLKQVTH